MTSAREPVANADPMVNSPTPPIASMDFQHHVNTYNRFLHLTKWFVIHLCVLLVSLYFFIIAANGIGGVVFLVLAIAALVYGIMSVPEGRTAAAAAAGATDREPDEIRK
ncbi:MAG TPA: aa3-type cytochrome c oxidase subunit IV [Devosia sp.]|jgi:hypothetical protein|nr:aa3-type cytochrome c oxidase subunit IV [Devosia sp.]